MTTLRRFSRLLRGQIRDYLLLVGAWSLLRVGTLIVGLLLQRTFDLLSGESRAGLNVWSLIAAVGGVEAARQLLQFTTIISRMEPDIVFRTRALLRDQLLTARVRAAAGRSDDGQVLTTLGTDVDEVSTFAAWSPANLARWLFAVVAIAILMTVDAVLASAVLGLLLLLSVAVRLLHGRYRRYRMAGVNAAAQVRGAFRDAIAGAPVIQAAHAEDHIGAHLHRLGEIRRRAVVAEETYASLQQSTVANVAPLGTGLVLLAASRGLSDGTLTVGDIALFGYYLQMLTEALASLGLLVVRLQRLGIALDRMYRSSPDGLAGRRIRLTDDEPPDHPADAGDTLPHEELRSLSVRSLSCRPAAGGPGVSDVSFTAAPRSLTVITGRVGAGKTTLIRAILGLAGPVEGEIRWNDMIIAPEALVPPRCAYVPQVPRLFTGTLRDNILLGAGADEDALAGAVRLARLEADLRTMPDGLGTAVGAGGLRLSGGQLQRVAIARALVRRPAVLVLDDGSSALDARTERELFAELRQEDVTVIAVSHRRHLLESADLIVVLDQGRMTGTGTLSELLTSSAGMRELWAAYAGRGA